MHDTRTRLYIYTHTRTRIFILTYYKSLKIETFPLFLSQIFSENHEISNLALIRNRLFSLLQHPFDSRFMSTTMARPGCSSDSGNRRQPSRLQKRAPALKIVPAPANNWKTAIPLLSPLALSPESPVDEQPPVENQTKTAVEKTPVFKTWQHPAAPFCYEPSSTFVPPFVPV
ncbi:hypothetical protein EUTSA_v10021654mg [Eutrema salsugineum]|uniref:Uncharacterized protein n=1 Tax=Eutrema salsugineum TaxID=72664 RepID=V4LAU8_EUTSA|nr:uncharacterized protein At4g14450, chloroplastic [Eutrema salsugineum]ESQ47525.1 hypothetical protein EUTSA_v10021654mg [Eutrema salsugineum]